MNRISFKYYHIKLEHIYVILSLIFGIIFVFINGPFQAPDEYSHFYRAYQISKGNLICEHHNNMNGAYVPKSLIMSNQIKLSEDIPFHSDKKFNIKNIMFELTHVQLNPKDEMFVAIPNTSAYAPIMYLPQSMGIEIGKKFNLSPLALMYLGRLFNLIFSTTMIYFSMKNISSKKSLLFLFGLMPMLLYESASLSADGVTNCLSIFTISYFIKLSKNGNEGLKVKEVLIMFLLICLVSLTKQVYFLFSLLYFLIPKYKFKSKKQHLILGFFIIILSILINLFWMNISGANHVLSTNSNASPKDQVIYILQHPILFIEIFARTITLNGEFYLKSFIGILGWLDTKLPNYIIYSYVIVLIVASLINNENEKINFKNRIILLLLFLSIGILVVTALYITYTLVGGSTVEGVQGRYFIPIALLLFLALGIKNIKIKYFNVFCVIYVILVLISTQVILFNRFY
ncbi:DUF2142 domain-containing protein [Clostridium pasteurianum]|uniref:Putative membrane protein n=1 Tax=Clostridium pasteurianum BC1 TaxID=86416 RepID=R4KBE9_CLOPA|nr:DUF2142 domain-containing protein [Clostridium pasteurianum]AGK97869.1 putative membrane protein [Clostridium pasteurianum BC1]